jgi:peptidoglycan-associated lipoprotein
MASLLITGVLLAGCAKRPATAQVGPPAPTGAAATTAATAPATAQPATSGGTGAGGGATAPATAAPGTAAPVRPSPKEFVAVPELRDVHFDFDKYDIRPDDAKILDSNAGWLKSNPNHLVLIEGHCDERGTNEYNLALGERRAKSTMNYLVSQGVQASRITIISYGEERPSCTQKNEECWAKNRRAHFLVKPR